MWCLRGTEPCTMRSSIVLPASLSPGLGALPAELLALDRLEERAEVAGPEALVALALDDLEEERPGGGLVVQPGRVAEEDLEQVGAGPGAVHQDLQLPE